MCRCMGWILLNTEARLPPRSADASVDSMRTVQIPHWYYAQAVDRSIIRNPTAPTGSSGESMF